MADTNNTDRAQWKFNALYADTEVRSVADDKLLAVVHAGPEQAGIVSLLKGASQPNAALADGWLPDGHLYAALGNLLAHLGAEGVVTTDHPFVLDTMAALKRIDGGVYLSGLAIPTEPDAYRADMLATVGLLEDGEWTEHHAKTPLGMRLEDEITKLHNELRDAQDAAPPTLNASKEGSHG